VVADDFITMTRLKPKVKNTTDDQKSTNPINTYSSFWSRVCSVNNLHNN